MNVLKTLKVCGLIESLKITIFNGKDELEQMLFELFLQSFETSLAFLRAKQTGKYRTPLKIAHMAVALIFFPLGI